MKLTKIITGIITLASLSLFAQKTFDTNGEDWKVPKFEIGYWCRKKFQNQGYITESTMAITAFGFHQLNAERIEIRCDSKNVRSQKIPLKLGFCLEATLKNDIRSNSGELRDCLIFSKVRSD